LYSQLALAAAGILPPLGALWLVLANRRTLKLIDRRLAEMRQVEAGMREMLAAPARLRAASKEIRDTITRIQESDHAESTGNTENVHHSAAIQRGIPGNAGGNCGMDSGESR
jgi:hypothetical protein